MAGGPQQVSLVEATASGVYVFSPLPPHRLCLLPAPTPPSFPQVLGPLGRLLVRSPEARTGTSAPVADSLGS